MLLRPSGRLWQQTTQIPCPNLFKEPRMAGNRKSTPEVEKVRTYLEGVAKNLVERLYGSKGPAWGTRLSELEDVALAVREFLSTEMLEQALTRQAADAERPADYQACPECGRPGRP